MSNTEKILKTITSLIENGILTSNDIKKEGFYYCASCYPNGNKVMKFILENSIQKDRYSI